VDRWLLVLRHAKSSWDVRGVVDHDRPLAPRGHEATERLRRYLEGLELPLELVLCSTAVRTVQTLEGIRAGLPEDVEVVQDGRLYAATAPTLLARLHEVPDATRAVLLIGHNPGAQDLVELLTANGDPDARERLATKYPTGGLAQLSVPAAWSELAWRSCALQWFVVPRELP
jgi:phosphohistidine phosphatase